MMLEEAVSQVKYNVDLCGIYQITHYDAMVIFIIMASENKNVNL